MIGNGTFASIRTGYNIVAIEKENNPYNEVSNGELGLATKGQDIGNFHMSQTILLGQGPMEIAKDMRPWSLENQSGQTING